MSIYGGFPTRSLEAGYNQQLCELLLILQQFVLHALKSRKADSRNWCEEFTKNYQKLERLEQHKHLVPNFSDYLKELDEYINATGNSIAKLSDRLNVPATSTRSFIREFEYSKIEFIRGRQSSLPSSRKKTEENFNSRHNPQRFLKSVKVKNYQDNLLQSILKDLSTPYVE